MFIFQLGVLLMTSKITVSSALATALFFCSVASAVAETATLRVECRKTSDRGCTGHQRVCFSTPNGHYMVEGSVSEGSVNNSWGKNATCGPANPDGYVAVSGTNLPFPPSYPTQFCASLHIESGSGLNNLGQVAFVNCNYSYRQFKYPE